MTMWENLLILKNKDQVMNFTIPSSDILIMKFILKPLNGIIVLHQQWKTAIEPEISLESSPSSANAVSLVDFPNHSKQFNRNLKTVLITYHHDNHVS